MLVPVAMMVVAVAAQLALWSVAGEAAQSAADQAAMAASALGGSVRQGQALGERVLARTGVAGSWRVVVAREGTEVVASVQGQVASLVPGWAPSVRALRLEPQIRFRAG